MFCINLIDMKKSLFFKSAFILLVGSVITRGLGFLIRIIFTRVIGPEGVNLHSLIMPTYSLVIAFTQLGLPVAISTVVARGVKRGKKILFSVIPIVLALNLVMMITIIISAPFIAGTLLDEPSVTYPIMSMAFILPFISISSILRGYFFGKQKMMPHTVSNVIEQIARLGIILAVLPKLVEYGPVYGIVGYILLSIISELISIVVFLYFLPKNFKIEKSDLKPDVKTTKEVMDLCLPTVGGRLIGNIFYFFEPIILTYVLKLVGYSNAFIVSEYGTYNVYVLPLLVIPSFLVQAVSTALVPEISKSYERKDNKKIKKRFRQSLIICFSLGLATNALVFIFPELLLKIIYNTTSGVEYVRVLAFFFSLYSLEGPLSSTLQALGHSKEAFRATTCGVLLRTFAITVCSLFKIGLYGLVIGEILDIVSVVVIDYFALKKAIK